MIVLDKNLFEIDVDDIDKTNVLHTMIGGKIVYARNLQGNEDANDLDDMLQLDFQND